MKTFVKIALIIAAAVVVLITAAALLVPRLVDPNQYKDRVATLVKENTGRDLAITGDISLSVFPWLGAEIGEVTLGNAPGFESDVFAGFEKVKVKIKLLPLLSKTIEADVITVEGLVLNLEKDADGSTNWEDLAAGAHPPEETAETPPEPGTSPTSSLTALAIGGLEILDARISWHDRQAGTDVTLDHLTLKTTAVNFEDPVDIQLGVDLDAGGMDLAGSIRSDVSVAFDLATGRYNANGLSLQADLRGDAVPGGNLALTLDGDAAFDTGTQAFNFEGLRLAARGLTLSPYTAEALVETSGAGDLAAGIIRIAHLKTTTTLTGDGERLTAELSATADADLTTRQFSISGLSITVPELAMKGFEGSIETDSPGSARADLTAGTLALDFPALSGTLAGEAVPGGPVPLALDLSVQGDLNEKAFSITPVKLSIADIAATVDLDVAQQEFGPYIKGSLAVAPFNPQDVTKRLGIALPDTADAKALSSAEMAIRFAAGTNAAEIENLRVKLDDTLLSGTLGVEDFASPRITFDMGADQVSLKRYLPPGGESGMPDLLSGITLKGALSADAGFKVFQVARMALAGKLDDLAFGLTTADVHADLAEEKISAKNLSLNAGDLSLEARADLSAFSTQPAFTAEVKTNTVNLRKILSDLKIMPETADKKVLRAVSLQADLSGTPQAVSVSGLTLHLDDTHVTGSADLALSPAPAYAFDITLDSIDADRYLPPAAPETTGKKKTEKTAPPAAGTAPTPLPVDLLRSLALDGKLAAGKLIINGLTFSDIRLQVAAKEGLLTIDPMNLDLYGGTSSGNIQLDARSDLPTLKVAETLAGVASGNLMKDLTGDAMVSGSANADIDLTAAGADTDALISSLGGTVSFTFTDGSIKGVDIVGKLCNTLMAVDAGSIKAEDLVGSALQKLIGKATGTQATNAVEESDSTSFSEMGGSMAFAKGVGTSEDLSLKSPLLRVRGAGSLDLTKQYLDYDATAYLVKSCQGQGGKGTDDLKNVPIPVTISGPLAKLKVKPNLTAGIIEVLSRSQSKKTGKTSATSSDKDSTTTSEPETVEDAVTGILQNLLKK